MMEGRDCSRHLQSDIAMASRASRASRQEPILPAILLILLDWELLAASAQQLLVLKHCEEKWR